MKKGMNQPTRGDSRRNAILEQQSASSGRYRGAPVMKEEHYSKHEKMQRQHALRCTKLVEAIYEKIKIYPQAEWCEVLLSVADRNKISIDDQLLIAQDLYEVHTSNKTAEKFLGISEKLQWYNSEIFKHYGEIQKQKQQASEFHSFLGEL